MGCGASVFERKFLNSGTQKCCGADASGWATVQAPSGRTDLSDLVRGGWGGVNYSNRRVSPVALGRGSRTRGKPPLAQDAKREVQSTGQSGSRGSGGLSADACPGVRFAIVPKLATESPCATRPHRKLPNAGDRARQCFQLRRKSTLHSGEETNALTFKCRSTAHLSPPRQNHPRRPTGVASIALTVRRATAQTALTPLQGCAWTPFPPPLPPPRDCACSVNRAQYLHPRPVSHRMSAQSPKQPGALQNLTLPRCDA